MKNRGWSPIEDEIVISGDELDLMLERLAAVGPGRSRQAVVSRRHILRTKGATFPHFRPQSDFDEE